MVTNNIQLEFANPQIRAIECLSDICEAAVYAARNLDWRYGVQLQTPIVTSNGKVVVELRIPEKIAESFSIGNHLRGISSFLLNMKEREYRRLSVGPRLLNYIEIADLNSKTEELTAEIRLGAMSSFANLLSRSDKKAMDQILRIITILNEPS